MYRVYYGHPGIGLFGWLWFAVFVALVVVAVTAVVHLWRHPVRLRPVHGWPGPGTPGGGWDPALQELRVRYARGEISWDEYLRRCAHLGYGAPAAPGTPGWGAPSSPPPAAGGETPGPTPGDAGPAGSPPPV